MQSYYVPWLGEVKLMKSIKNIVVIILGLGFASYSFAQTPPADLLRLPTGQITLPVPLDR